MLHESGLVVNVNKCMMNCLLSNMNLDISDGASTIQMYSSTSTITLNMHEYEYSENKCTRVYEYDYFTI